MRNFRLMHLLCCLLLLCTMLSSCTARTARHLPRNEWSTGATQSLAMRYMTFQYRASIPEPDSPEFVEISGMACPDLSKLPDWAAWYGEGTLTIYVVDKNGLVLAENEEDLLPCPLTPNECLPIDGRLDTKTVRPEAIFITFGYRIGIADGDAENATQRTFIAEDAFDQ